MTEAEYSAAGDLLTIDLLGLATSRSLAIGGIEIDGEQLPPDAMASTALVAALAHVLFPAFVAEPTGDRLAELLDMVVDQLGDELTGMMMVKVQGR